VAQGVKDRASGITSGVAISQESRRDNGNDASDRNGPAEDGEWSQPSRSHMRSGLRRRWILSPYRIIERSDFDGPVPHDEKAICTSTLLLDSALSGNGQVGEVDLR